ncbi:MAG TPA: helix-turn-helix transcriptional regulator [Pyrinomonadaceae bacterium]|nr:helix-turn-helix transcriptional regulator [Pyrinomonadaceae bacterium]
MKLSDFKPREVNKLMHRRACMRKGRRTYRIFSDAYTSVQIPEKELAKESPDEPVVNRISALHKRTLTTLGKTEEYKQAIKKYPPVNKRRKKKAEDFMSWLGGDTDRPASKRRKEVSDEETLPDGLQNLFTSFNRDTPEQSASGFTESIKPQETSNGQTVSRKAYEVVSHIQDMAKKKGIENAFQLWQKIGGSKESAAQLWRGDFKKIGISTLKKLCEVLGCGVGDLLVFEPSTASRTS